MKKYWDYARIGIKEQIAYPGAVWARFLSKLIYLYLQFCIWSALFSSDGLKNSELSKDGTLRYIIMAVIVSTVMECNIIERINEQIRSGNIAMELIRPIDFRVTMFFRHLGHTVIELVCCLVPLVVLIHATISLRLLCPEQIGVAVFSVFLAYGIQFLYSLIIGLLAFWLIVTWPINMFFGAIYKLLSGAWIPIGMFPNVLYRINLFLPFRAIYYIPVSLLTSRRRICDIYASIGIQILWLLILYLAAEMIWRVGRNKLIVQGG